VIAHHTFSNLRKEIFCLLMALTGIFSLSGGVFSQTTEPYLTYDELTLAVKKLADSHRDLVKLESVGKTAEGRDIWVLTLANEGAIPLTNRPALLVAANFEADHVIGSSLALSMARYLVEGYSSDEEIKKCLDNHVIYLIPRVNADGAETFFGKVQDGRKTNTTAFDADNDGRLDEDGPEDLNHDGQITVMRVKDPNGKYCIDPKEPLLMKKADPSKGERGEYSIYFEGIDNDKDGFINEDPAGGTDLNRNFQHAYPYYKENAGRYMVSELETRAMVEWMLHHQQVALVMTFGESDNLIVPPTSRGQLSTDRPLDLLQFAQASVTGASRVGMVNDGGRFGRGGRYMVMGDYLGGASGGPGGQQSSNRNQRPSQTAATTINSADLGYFTKVSEKYKELTGIKTQPVLRNPEGAFFQYTYYQLGIPSFSTPGWGLVFPPDSSRRPGRGGMGQRPGGSENNGGNQNAGEMEGNPLSGGGALPGGGSFSRMTGGAGIPANQQESAQVPGIDATYLKYLKGEKIKGFVEWQTIKHPDFGDVEIGGFTPAEIDNPPVEKIQELGISHAKFALYLSSLFARITIAKTDIVNEGGGLFRIKAEVSNEGVLPTALRQGVVSRSVKPTMVQLEVKPDQIISGNSKTNFFQALEGAGSRQKFEWLIKGRTGDQIELKVVSQKGGTDITKITLK